MSDDKSDRSSITMRLSLSLITMFAEEVPHGSAQDQISPGLRPPSLSSLCWLLASPGLGWPPYDGCYAKDVANKFNGCQRVGPILKSKAWCFNTYVQLHTTRAAGLHCGSSHVRQFSTLEQHCADRPLRRCHGEVELKHLTCVWLVSSIATCRIHWSEGTCHFGDISIRLGNDACAKDDCLLVLGLSTNISLGTP